MAERERLEALVAQDAPTMLAIATLLGRFVALEQQEGLAPDALRIAVLAFAAGERAGKSSR